jgi:hypothetical protein
MPNRSQVLARAPAKAMPTIPDRQQPSLDGAEVALTWDCGIMVEQMDGHEETLYQL